MQQPVGDVRVRCVVVVVVQLQDVGVLLRLAVGAGAVDVQQHLLPGREFTEALGYRVAGARDAATGAGHDLHQVVADVLTCEHAFHQRFRIRQTRDHRDPDRGSARRHRRLLHSLEAPHLLVVEVIDQLLAGEFLDRHPEGRLSDATGRTEQHPGPGHPGVGLVEVARFHFGGVEPNHVDHLEELGGGQHRVHVADAVGRELRTRCFVLLGQARDDRDHVQVIERDAEPAGEMVLDGRAHHLLRRPATGQMGDEARIALLHQVDPAGAAGGELGHDTAFAHPVQELGRLLEDGQIGREGEVKDPVEADGPHHAGDETGRLAELDAVPGGDHAPRCGGHEPDDEFGGVVEGHEHVRAFADVVEGAAGAGSDALATGDAVGVDQRASVVGSHRELTAVELVGQHRRAFDLGAGRDAQSARDALVVVPDDERVVADDGHVRTPVQRLYVHHSEVRRGLAQVADEPRLAAATQTTGCLGSRIGLGEPEFDLGESLGAIGGGQRGHLMALNSRERLVVTLRWAIHRATAAVVARRFRSDVAQGDELVHRTGRPPPGSHRLDDGSGPAHAVTAGENLQLRRLHRRPVDLDVPPLVEPHREVVVEELGVRALADGTDHQGRGEFELAPFDRDRTPTSGAVRFAEFHAETTEHQSIGRADYGARSRQENEFHALGRSIVHLV